MKVLITGAGGQLGLDVQEVFSAPGHHDVVACSRDQLDLTRRDSVLSAITSVAPEVVIHCGAYTAVDQAETEMEAAFTVNALGTRHVVDAAEIVGARVVYVSTDYVFDGTSQRPYLEWDKPNPLNVYGASKLAGESECRPSDTVIRTSWVFGRHGHNIVKTLVDLASGLGQFTFVDDQRGKPTSTQDLAAAIYQLAVEKLPGTFHVTNDTETSWFDLAQDVFRMAGADPGRIRAIKTKDLDPPRAAVRPRYSVLDNFAWRKTGFAPLGDHRDAVEKVVKELVGQ